MQILLMLSYNLWRILDVGIMVLAVYSMVILFSEEKTAKNTWFIVALFLMYRICRGSDAAISMNYMWPLALGLYSITAIKESKNKRIGWKKLFIYTLTTLYAANMEQMAVVLLIVFALYVLFLFFTERKVNCIAWLLSLVIVELIYILTCPGNSVRFSREIANHFQNYLELTIFQKIYMVISSTIYQLMWSEGLLMTILAFLVCVLIHLQNKSKFLKILSFIPITFCLLPMINYNSHLIDLSNLTWCNTNQNNIGITVYNCYEIKYYIPFVIFSMVYVILLICIFYSLYPNKNAGLAIGVLVLGMIARGAMTISPTIWASNLRTFIYTYASIAICAFIIIQEIEKKIKTSQKDMLYYAIGVASSLSFIMIMLE